MKTRLPILSVVLLLVIAGCINRDHFNFEKVSETSWNPKLAIPLLKSNIGLYQLVGVTDSNAVSITDNNVKLVYGGQSLNLKLDNLIEIEDIATPSPGPLMPYTTSSTNVPAIPATEFDQLDAVEFSAGQLTVKTLNEITPATITFTFLDIIDANSQPLIIDVEAGNSATVNLAGYTMDVSKNEIRLSIVATAIGNCTVSFSFSSMDYVSVTGDFSNELGRVGKKSFQLHLFKSIGAKGDIELADPQLKINADNGIGVSLEPDFTEVIAINPASGDRTQLVESNSATPLRIDASSGKGKVQKSSIVLNSRNSNLPSFLSISPKTIEHNLGLSVASGTAPHTVHKGSECDLSMQLEIPLEGKITSFEVLDTIALQITNDLSLIKDFLIKTYTKNGYPLDAKISITLMDENKKIMNKIDGSPMVLLDEIFTQAASVGSDGLVTAPAEYSAEHDLVDEEVLARLPDARYGQLRASMNTTNSGKDNVKIQADYELEVTLGIKVTGNINTFNQGDTLK